MATSQLETSLNSGSLANVDAPANRGTLVPLTGCMGFLFFFFSLIYYNEYYGCFIRCFSFVGRRNNGRLIIYNYFSTRSHFAFMRFLCSISSLNILAREEHC